jgi:pyruvate dehydrogenase E2 component (dihydrolipoamide acetyltransferase)
MPKVLTLPKIGVSMTEATIVRWLVKEGDYVNADQPVLEAETEKAAQEIPSTVSGVLAKILVKPGDTVQCQEPIAVFVEKGEALPEGYKPEGFMPSDAGTGGASAARAQSGTVPAGAAAGIAGAVASSPHLGQPDAARPTGGPGADGGGQSRVKISPLARKLAMELGLDYTRIVPSKPGGRIEREDVLSHAADMKAMGEAVPRRPQAPGETPGAAAAAPGETPRTEPAAAGAGQVGRSEAGGELIPLQGTRKVIAQRMFESARGTARAALFSSADASGLFARRGKLNEKGTKIGYTDMFVMAAAKALAEFPALNSRMEGNAIRVPRDINVGVAVDTEHGLMVPVIRNADRKGIAAISGELAEKAERARARKSTREDISEGTFTVTNLGMYGVESFVPIINPPECAILAVGAILRRPVAVKDRDAVEVRPVCALTLVFDHRIVDGAPAARFLQKVKELIENPEWCVE